MRYLAIILITFFQISYLSAQIDQPLLSKKNAKAKERKEQLPKTNAKAIGFRLSPNAIEKNIKYGARDSSWVDVKNKLIYLFGESYMDYDGYKLNAGHIRLDFENDLAYAEYMQDSLKKGKIGLPAFEYDGQTISAEKLKFNYKTKKGIVEESKMSQGEFSIHGQTTKIIGQDSLHSIEDLIFQKNALISTCNHEHPHYGIRTRKIKIIPNRVAIIGFSQLEIAGVPTPLFLPYGLFPLTGGVQSSGLIFPRNYEYDDQKGFGFRGIGYYFPINDYMDLKLLGNIYTRGSHMLSIESNYKKRYKYNGNVQLSYTNDLLENGATGRIESSKSFRFYLKHNQDRKAHPYRKFGGSIDIQTNGYQARNFNDYSSQVRNILTSNFSYTDNMPGTPFTFILSMNHRQNTQTNKLDITLPKAQLRMQTIYPFKNKNGGGAEEKWYEKINVGYNAEMKNYVSTIDSTLFTQETVDKIVTGANHSASISASFKALKYFNISPSVNAEQIFTLKTKEKYLNQTPKIDTIGTTVDQNGNTIYETKETYDVVDEFKNGFDVYNGWTAALSVNTQIFGTKRWRKGWLRGIRHTIQPSVSLNYSNPTERYYREYYTHPDSLESQYRRYNRFEGGAYSRSLRETQLGFNYSIVNLFEAKYYSKKDEEEKKFKPLRRLSINGRYNYAKDSLKWSEITMSANTELFKGITSVTLNAQYDPYAKDSSGKRINKTAWEQDGKLLTFNYFNVTINNRFTVKRITELFSKKPSSKEDKDKNNEGVNDVERSLNNGMDLYQEAGKPLTTDEEKTVSKGDRRTFYDYIKDFSVHHSWKYGVYRDSEGDLDPKTTTHTIGVSGRIPLTDNWNVSVGNISYDLSRKSFVYPSFGLERDLHCWNMSISWQPRNETYSFFIGVKSSNLSFLKYNYGQQRGQGSGSGLLGG